MESKEHVDASITMLDVLEQEREEEEEYAAVLGASDDKCCTYAKGPVKRQALYSCLTCCPDAAKDLDKCAGICLACSYRCHENHELVELYTKRQFRCDCPTERMGGDNKCLLNETNIAYPKNEGNLYNQNFQGLYCNCHRPYPDPERTEEEVMLQCAICEDWYHLPHLEAPDVAPRLLDACSEVICNGCMAKHEFLKDYTGLSIKALEDLNESQANVTVGGDNSICENEDNKLHSELDKSISEIMGGEEAAEAAKGSVDDVESVEPALKKQKLEADVDVSAEKDSKLKPQKLCRRPKAKTDYEKGATFWRVDWRAALCQCEACLQMYKDLQVEFLTDAEDSAKSYEERGMQKVAGESSYEQGIRALASIGRVQQVEAITEYNHMKDKLKEYLQTFAVSKKVVTEEDINRFFEQMRNEKNSHVGQPFFCR